MIRILPVLFALVYSLPSSAGEPTSNDVIVEGVRLGRTIDRTRVVFDLSAPVTYRVDDLSSSSHYMVYLDNVELNCTLGNKVFDKTPITAMRCGPAGEVVFDLASSAIEVNSFPLKPFQGRGHRLVFDFYIGHTPEAPAAVSVVEQHTLVEQARRIDEEDQHGTLTQYSDDETPAVVPEKSISETKRALVVEKGGSNTDVNFGGTWEQEWAVTNGGSSQKFEAIVEPRWDVQISNALSFSAIARIRADAIGDLGPDENHANNYSGINGPLYNNKYAELSLRELYFDYAVGSFYWRLGKQQVVWGQADGIKVLDVVNPQSFREFILDDFDDSRIPLWMVNLEYSFGESSSLQLLWIPDTTYHELAEFDSPYFFTSPRVVPNLAPSSISGVADIDKPDDFFADSDAGFRLTSFVGGWDVSLNYLYQYLDAPVLYQYRQSDGQIQVRPEYERSHLLGGTLSNAFGDFTLRGELAYNSDSYSIANDVTQQGIVSSGEVSTVLGLDWQVSSDTLLSAQWFYSYLTDYERSIVRDEAEQIVSLLLLSDFDNASWQIHALTLYSLNDNDSLLQLKLKYWLRSDLEIWLGADIFDGQSTGLFGQFSDEDRFILGMKYGF